jgi:hypothetical protein
VTNIGSGHPQDTTGSQSAPQCETKVDDVIKCNLCNRTFTRKDTLKRHQDKYCKPSDNIQQQFYKMQNQIDELKKLLVNKEVIVRTPDFNPNTYPGLYNDGEFAFCHFPCASKSMISEETLTYIVNQGSNAVSEYIKQARFATGQNLNAYIESIDAINGYVYKGKWIKEAVGNICNDILDKSLDHLYTLKHKYMYKVKTHPEIMPMHEAFHKLSNEINDWCLEYKYERSVSSEIQVYHQLVQLIKEKLIEVKPRVPIMFD